jgi:putative polyhydroxyalkanoate system protein
MREIVAYRRHRLGLVKAKRLAETMARRLRDQFGGSYTWKGNTLHFRRPGASGHLGVTKADVEVRVEIGLLLTPLRSRIEREIAAFCDQHFAPTGSADADQPARAAASRSGSTRSLRTRRMSRSGRPT